MPMHDWIDKYPQVAALLQAESDEILGASVEEEASAAFHPLAPRASGLGGRPLRLVTGHTWETVYYSVEEKEWLSGCFLDAQEAWAARIRERIVTLGIDAPVTVGFS
jgi:hypothetical protein